MDTGDGRGQAGSLGAKTLSLPLAPSGRESTCSGHGGRKLPSPTLEHLKGCRVHDQVAHRPPTAAVVHLLTSTHNSSP